MTMLPLKFPSGLMRDETRYSGDGHWYDCNMVRFRFGMPEKIGGWAKKISSAFLGVCRSLFSWTLLTGNQYFGLGTHLKFYVSDGGSFFDVTPLRRTTALGADPFSVQNGVTSMTVTDVANGAYVGDFVTFSGATAFAGLATTDLNKNFQIVSISDPDHYTVTLDVTPNATTTGGGAAVTAQYEIHVGLDTTVLGLGWGAGSWGHDTWGADAAYGPAILLRLWSQNSFGQDLIANVRLGGIYHWDATNPTDRMVALSDLPGQSDAPTIATITDISAEEQHVMAYGTNAIGSATQDPLFIRWSDTQSYLNWTPSPTNTAGGYRLSVGTQIVAQMHTRSQALIWTDLALYTQTWVGFPYVFNFQLVAFNVNIIAPNAAASVNDIVMWMGREQFYMYDGRVSPVPCPISDYIFTNINLNQIYKIYGFTNSLFDEMGWLYPSLNSDECDSYVIYNYKEQAWYFGTLPRTAWLDLGGSFLPIATDANGYLYNQETGFDDGSTNPPSGIDAYIETGPLENSIEGMGDHFLFLDRLIPDLTFRNSSATNPSVTMTISTRDYPGAAVAQSNSSTITQANDGTFTNQSFIRLRGRSASFRIESTGTGVTWRLGIPRVSYRLDGRR